MTEWTINQERTAHEERTVVCGGVTIKAMVWKYRRDDSDIYLANVSYSLPDHVSLSINNVGENHTHDKAIFWCEMQMQELPVVTWKPCHER